MPNDSKIRMNKTKQNRIKSKSSDHKIVTDFKLNTTWRKYILQQDLSEKNYLKKL